MAKRTYTRLYGSELVQKRKSNLVFIAARMLGSQDALAAACGVSAGHISTVVRAYESPEGIPIEMAHRIEKATKGKLKAWMFRSDKVKVPRVAPEKVKPQEAKEPGRVPEPA